MLFSSDNCHSYKNSFSLMVDEVSLTSFVSPPRTTFLQKNQNINRVLAEAYKVSKSCGGTDVSEL